MTWSEHLDPDSPRADDTEEERELRILLHRAAPELPAPDDRMDRIRERADRTRRRRRLAGLTAGLTTGLVAAFLAAAPATAPAPSPAALQPAGTPPPTTAPLASPAATPSTPTATDPTVFETEIPFGVVDSLRLDVPSRWYTLHLPTSDPPGTVGYTATQPLTNAPSCTWEQIFCLTTGPLDKDGVLITFGLVRDHDLQGKLATATGPAVDVPLDKECVQIGGTRELRGHDTVVAADATVVIELTACLREPGEKTLQQVQRVLASVRPAEDSTIQTGGGIGWPSSPSTSR
ncbi:hypothetical protein ACGFZP_24645 [Kitasatospora sp. NPDC048239]|uniref:hypothetical protein n=1 Tax=Kitasatospora sp. NPDC048239 TaxID=3364046 RepID=UPI0037227D4B